MGPVNVHLVLVAGFALIIGATCLIVPDVAISLIASLCVVGFLAAARMALPLTVRWISERLPI